MRLSSCIFFPGHGRRSARRGFSLVETMIAVGIVAIGMLATMSLQVSMIKSNSIEQERARAHQIISQEMERVRLELYTRVTQQQLTTLWDNGTPDDPTDDTIGTLEVRIYDPESGALLAAAPNPARRVEVEVTLSWSPRGSRGTTTLRESAMTYISP